MMKKVSLILVLFSINTLIFAHSISAGVKYSYNEYNSIYARVVYDNGCDLLGQNNFQIALESSFGAQDNTKFRIDYHKLYFSHKLSDEFVFASGVGGYLRFTGPNLMGPSGWLGIGVVFVSQFQFIINKNCSWVMALNLDFGGVWAVGMKMGSGGYSVPLSVMFRYNFTQGDEK